MPKKVSDILSQDELNLLQEVIESQAEHSRNDIAILDISKQLLNILAQSSDIVLIAQREQEEYRFPLYLLNDELKELGLPDIIDHKGGGGRYWRFSAPKGLKIFDHKGDVLLGIVSNISTSGLFMLCSEQQLASSGLNLKEGANLRFYLKIPQRGFHLVDATVVRIESEKNNIKGLALKFNINAELTLILHNYIVEQHDLLHDLE
jgi:hypothetical protein